MKYYISDLHLFHENAIAFDPRPFASLQEMHDTIGKEHYSLVLSHYPIFSWRNMGRGRILLYGHTHESEEDRFYQKCLSEMRANDCRHVYEAEELRAYNVGCMRDYMNYTPRTLKEILNSRSKV